MRRITAGRSWQWRHNGHDGVSNYQPHHCLLNCLFRRKSKKTSKLRVIGFCAGNSPMTGVNSPHKWSVTRKMFKNIWWRHHVKEEPEKFKMGTTNLSLPLIKRKCDCIPQFSRWIYLFSQRFVWVLMTFKRFWYTYFCFDANHKRLVLASIQMSLGQQVLDTASCRHYYYYSHLLSIVKTYNLSESYC